MHRFDAYLKLLLHYQKRTNLIGCESVSQIVEDLFIDSLQILRTGDLGATCVDVGSGAGFPAIPLQIMASPAAFHLVEPRTKRYAFLQCVCRELGFSTVIVHNAKIENCDLASVDFAISKAFAPILDWLETARRWTECGAQVARRTRGLGSGAPSGRKRLCRRRGDRRFATRLCSIGKAMPCIALSLR